ncbi:hypothetical protein [Peptoniphilus sp. EMRHCC_23]|uniref:hypothetical protein n=1 Tax=Peptoniphilus rachelemmaiella TaxID=2811779 RepID=UPI001C006B83|nr:hypothetical protein [Peptoniphilus rachelemmaiella]
MNTAEKQVLYIAAFRYALGRSTYIVDIIARILKDNSDELTEKSKDLIIKEIAECKNLGMDCDAKAWRGLSEHLSDR